MMKWSHDDLVTGERLQALADVTVLTRPIFDFHASLPQSGVRYIAGFRGSQFELEVEDAPLARLRDQRVIFVYTHLMRSFVERVLPRLDHRFVLMSHNSDHGVGGEFRTTLDDPRIIHWFAQNTLIRHPKLTALPIGIANAQWPHGDLAALLAVANRPRPVRRDVVYLNFEVRTNPAVRIPLMQRLAASAVVWRAPQRAFADYLEDMAQCRWVVSPPGNGVDCHRTWEALYLGATPLVAASESGRELHDGLPVIQLAELGALNRELLEREQLALPAAGQSIARLRMSYWRNLLAQQLDPAAQSAARSTA